MDLFETLGLGPRQPEENELYIAIYTDPATDSSATCDGSDHIEPRSWQPAEEKHPSATLLSEPSGSSVTSSSNPLGDAGTVTPDRMELLRARCTAWLMPYTTDYVWNKDPLVLRASSRQAPPWERRRGPAASIRRRKPEAAGSGSGAPSGGDGPSNSNNLSTESGQEAYLWSVMRLGDAVDDEWWVVWLLLRMTRELQDLSVQVWDNDGQFLLIEAAYALPRWLKPETADNRVWLRHGRLHIIPLPSAAAPGLPASPTVTQALAVLREGRFATASQRVQRPIDQRLEGYPARAHREQQHVARCLLPVPLVAALRIEPQLVSELVDAFYLRDADDMRIAARMQFLPPSLERVPSLVRMTRCRYAQLAAQRFSAPRGMTMPPPDSPLGKAADLGLKLTVAAEVICSRYAPAMQQQQQQEQCQEQCQEQKGEAAAVGAAAALSEARFALDPTWRRFKASLEANDYFQGNIPGSQRYKELLAEALRSYTAGLAAEVNGDGGSKGPGGRVLLQHPRHRLAELVLGAVATGIRAEFVTGGPSSWTAEDDDSWLDQQPDRLQSELDRRQAELTKRPQGHIGEGGPTEDVHVPGKRPGTQANQPQATEVVADDIATKLRGFMDQLSGLEGVEVSGDKAAPLGSSGAGAGAGADGVDFIPAKFLRELEKVLGGDGESRVCTLRQHRAGEMQNGMEEDGVEEENDEGESSTEEGSSFFSSEDDDTDSTEDAEQEDDEDAEAEEEKERNGKTKGFGAGKTVRFAASAAGPGSAAATGKVTAATTAEDHVEAATGGDRRQAVTAARAVSKGAPLGTGATRPAPSATMKPGFLSHHGINNVGSGSAASQPRASTGSLGGSEGGLERQDGGTCSYVGDDSIGGSVGGLGNGARLLGAAAGRRLQLDWEVRTATDSDDEDYSEWIGKEDFGGDIRIETAQPRFRKRNQNQRLRDLGDGDDDDDSDDDHAATTRLFAALGVRGSTSGSSNDDGSDISEEDERQGSPVPSAHCRPSPERQQSNGVVCARPLENRGDGARGNAAAGASAAREKKSVGASSTGRGPGCKRNSDSFMSLYDSALQAELGDTTLAQSFNGRSAAATSVAGAWSSDKDPGASSTQGLKPVDLDMNLVQNLLRSYTAQQGCAGPAGNVAAMLGLSLPAGDVED